MYTSNFAALALLLSSSASAYTLQNVTVGSQDPDILYYPICSLRSYSACVNGAWYEMDDSRFNDGVAMVCNDPTVHFQNFVPYFTYSFRGSAMYMYQWMNSSTANQLQTYDNIKSPPVNLTTEFPQFATSGDLVSVLAWSLEGLDPLQVHTIAVQHVARGDGTNTQLIFDYMVVTMTQLPPSDAPSKKKLTKGEIAGVVVGAILGAAGLILGFIFLRRYCRRRDAANKSQKPGAGGKWTWEGSVVKPGTLKFADPSSEIEASERIAREGRIEEDENERKVESLA